MCVFILFIIYRPRRRHSRLERSPRKRTVGCSKPSRDTPYSDSYTAKRTSTSVSGTGPRKWPLKRDAPCHSRCGMLKNTHCSMAMGAEYRSTFEPFIGNDDVSIWVKNSRVGRTTQTNKQTDIIYQRKQNFIIWWHYCPYLNSVLFSFTTSLSLLWFSIKNSEGRINRIEDKM